MSFGSEIVPMGDRVFIKSFGVFLWSGVSTTPGATALKRMLFFAYSERPGQQRLRCLAKLRLRSLSSCLPYLAPVAFPENPEGLDSLQRGSGAHGRNSRDAAVDQEVCPDDVRRIVRREVDCQLRDFQRIGDPLAWIVGSEDALDRLALLFAWETTEHRGVRRTGLRVFTQIPRAMS